MRSCHHLLWLPLILGSAVSAIYINPENDEVNPMEVGHGSGGPMENSEIFMEPMMAADLQAPLSFYMKGLENEGTDVNEVKKIRELREKLDKMRAYLCSSFSTLTCRTVRHYLYQLGLLEDRMNLRLLNRQTRVQRMARSIRMTKKNY